MIICKLSVLEQTAKVQINFQFGLDDIRRDFEIGSTFWDRGELLVKQSQVNSR
jgi:hypothetical protein